MAVASQHVNVGYYRYLYTMVLLVPCILARPTKWTRCKLKFIELFCLECKYHKSLIIDSLSIFQRTKREQRAKRQECPRPAPPCCIFRFALVSSSLISLQRAQRSNTNTRNKRAVNCLLYLAPGDLLSGWGREERV